MKFLGVCIFLILVSFLPVSPVSATAVYSSYSKAVSYARRGDFEKAKDELAGAPQGTSYTQLTLRIITDVINKKIKKTAGIYIFKTIDLIGKRDLKNALVNAETAVSFAPYYPGVYLLKGNVYYRQGKHNLALRDYTRALRLSRRSFFAPFVYYNRAEIYFNKADYRRALYNYNKVLALNPEDAQAYNNRGLVYYVMKKYSRAQKDFNRAVNLSPMPRFYNNRAELYIAVKKFNLALRDYARALSSSYRNFFTYYNRANLYYQQKEFSKAISDYNQALKIWPSYYAFFNRAVTCEKLGYFKQAADSYKEALKDKFFQNQRNYAAYAQERIRKIESLTGK